MKIAKTYFKELSEDVRYIREKVFVEEQGFCKEFDEYDQESFYIVVYCDNKAVATGRAFPNSKFNNVFTIGRVAVLPEYRHMHLGKMVLECLEEKAKAEGAIKVELSAQCRVQNFYQRNGYVASGDIYYDEFCPHIHMEKLL